MPEGVDVGHSRFFGKRCKGPDADLPLLLKQEVVHFRESALYTRAFSRQGGGKGKRMIRLRPVAKIEDNVFTKPANHFRPVLESEASA